MTKPPPPATLFAPWSRIPIDCAEGTPARRIIELGIGAANGWALGPSGFYQSPDMSLAALVRRAVEEALLHLLELGLIDVDTDRMSQAFGFPIRREAAAGGSR